MNFYISTTVKERGGRILASGADFMRALEYIRVRTLQEITVYRHDTAILVFKGYHCGMTMETVFVNAEEIQLPYMPPYDIKPRIFWRNRELAKGQELNFIDLLGYIKTCRHEIVRKDRGNFSVNTVRFYSNFGGFEYRRNRIELTVTRKTDDD